MVNEPGVSNSTGSDRVSASSEPPPLAAAVGTTIKHNPALLSDDLLERTFAGRDPLLADLVERVRQNSGRENVQHYLLIGPRGSGKTTLLRMLALRVRQDPTLNQEWLPVPFAEEEFSISDLKDFFLVVLERMGTPASEVEAARAGANELAGRDPAEALRVAQEAVERAAATRHRRLLLLVDNLDQVLDQVAVGDDLATRQLRSVLQHDPLYMLVGSTTAIFEELVNYERPLYQFFAPIQLQSLDQRGILELLQRRAIVDGNAAFQNPSPELKRKVRVITTITGGSPRLVVALYDVLGNRPMLETVDAFTRMMDELTPYYKARLEMLPQQQRKIVDAIVRAGGSASPTDLATSTGLRPNLVASQLSRLRESGWLHQRRGENRRGTRYALTDQLFRIWYRMRYLSESRRRLLLMVDFYQALFNTGELAVLHERLLTQLESVCYLMATEESTSCLARSPVQVDDLAIRLRSVVEAMPASSERDIGRWRQARGLIEAGALDHARDLLETSRREHQERDAPDSWAVDEVYLYLIEDLSLIEPGSGDILESPARSIRTRLALAVADYLATPGSSDMWFRADQRTELTQWSAVEWLGRLADRMHAQEKHVAALVHERRLVQLARRLYEMGDQNFWISTSSGWSAHVRAYLALHDEEALATATEAAAQDGEVTVAQVLQACRDPEQWIGAVTLALSSEAALWRSQRAEEALTVALIMPSTFARMIELVVEHRQLEYGVWACEEAVRISRLLEDRPCIAFHLHMMAAGARRQLRFDDAYSLLEEAIAIYRSLVDVDPKTFLPLLAATLVRLGMTFVNQRLSADAETPYREALGIYRALDLSQPGAFSADIATILTTLGTLLASGERLAEARNLHVEATGIWRQIATSSPSDSPQLLNVELGITASHLAEVFADPGRLNEAWGHIGQVLRIVERSPMITGVVASVMANILASAPLGMLDDRLSDTAVRRLNRLLSTAAPLASESRAEAVLHFLTTTIATDMSTHDYESALSLATEAVPELVDLVAPLREAQRVRAVGDRSRLAELDEDTRAAVEQVLASVEGRTAGAATEPAANPDRQRVPIHSARTSTKFAFHV